MERCAGAQQRTCAGPRWLRYFTELHKGASGVTRALTVRLIA